MVLIPPPPARPLPESHEPSTWFRAQYVEVWRRFSGGSLPRCKHAEALRYNVAAWQPDLAACADECFASRRNDGNRAHKTCDRCGTGRDASVWTLYDNTPGVQLLFRAALCAKCGDRELSNGVPRPPGEESPDP